MIDDNARRAFQTVVWDYYHEHGRDELPWRKTTDAYSIMVSELMLQQTQVNRVAPKYNQFLQEFPTVRSLAQAPLGDVLRMWSGLGYNRRAKFLWQAAQSIVNEYDGAFPEKLEELVALPGIGPNTAGAILAYAYNQPVIFVETNIRTVFIHHFFHDQTGVADKTILELVDITLDGEHPREWYWALMDYGTHLKQSVGNLNQLSKTYAKQSTFHGSRRQVRGQVLKLLGTKPHTLAALQKSVADTRLQEVIDDLMTEQLIQYRGKTYYL